MTPPQSPRATSLRARLIVLALGLALSASSFTTGAGQDLTLSAQRIAIEALKDTLAIDQQGIGRYGHEQVARSDETLSGGRLNAGGGIALQSLGDITLTGASLAADSGQARLIAGGDISQRPLGSESFDFLSI